MARIAFILPREDIMQDARAAAAELGMDVVYTRTIQTDESIAAAREAAEAGADIVVARGLQAAIIKANTAIPLVTVQFTAQEVGMLVRQAIRASGREDPVVTLIGHANMFQDISLLGELLNVRFRIRFLDSWDADPLSLRRHAEQAIAEGADVLIGGEIACWAADEAGIPYVFLASSRECLDSACKNALRLAYAIDLEQRSKAELQSILDYTVSGLIFIDFEGIVRQLNPSAEHLLGADQQELLGQPVWKLLPDITSQMLEDVLRGGRDITAARIRRGELRLAASVSAVTSDNRVTGAVVDIRDIKQARTFTDRERVELLRQGFIAPFTFESMAVHSPKMVALVEAARRCAAFRAPLLIQGEIGTERLELAQCIRNAAGSTDNILVQYRCDLADPEQVEARLFGECGLIEQAQGDIFLDEVGRLSRRSQGRLLDLISERFLPEDGDLSPRLRIIAGSSENLAQLVQNGSFDRELYYALSVSVLTIPPLRERPEDTAYLADYFLRIFQKRHGRYIHMTKNAWTRLRSYSWPGNLAEMKNVCERIVINAPHRTVDEAYVAGLLVDRDEPAPAIVPATLYSNPDAARIVELLATFHGNRVAVAQALNISTTTLWRRMKKYGITG